MGCKSVITNKVPMLFLFSLLTACGGGGNNGSQNELQDAEPPVITLNGNDSETVFINTTYSDTGAVVTDNVDTNLTVIISGIVNTSAVGIYTLTYNAIDAHGNAASEVTREVSVVDNVAPEIALNGEALESIVINSEYIDASAIVTDNVDSNLVAEVIGEVDSSTAGEYTLIYRATDSAGNIAAEVTRVVNVIDGIAFNVPSSFYRVRSSGLNSELRVYRYMLISDQVMSYGSSTFNYGSLDAYSSSIQYFYSDNSWVEYDLANYPIEMTNANTRIEGEIFHGAIIESEDLSNIAINIFEQEDEYGEPQNQPDFIMPPGSKRFNYRYKSSGTHYRLFSNMGGASSSNLSTFISDRCDDASLTINVESEYFDYGYIPCEQADNTSGTLVGIYEGTEIPNVGTWKIENISDSNIEALILEFDSSLLDENSYLKTSHRIFSIIDDIPWIGVMRRSDYMSETLYYNEIAFDAILSAYQR